MKKLILVLFFTFFTCYLYAAGHTEKTLELINEGKNDEAIVYMKSVLSEKTETADSYIVLGIAYTEKGEYELAEESLKKALLIQRKAVPAHYMLAMLYEKQGKIEEAVNKWEKICKYTRNEKLKTLAQKHLEQLKEEL